MGGTQLGDANFTPTLQPYSGVQPFRFWCQKVLPLVYDDSLSYYELLCKVVKRLNEIQEDVVNLYAAFEQLQEYVNDSLYEEEGDASGDQETK